jgi:hypothetical protein
MEHTISDDDGAEAPALDVQDLANHLVEQASRVVSDVTGWATDYGIVILLGTPDREIVFASNVMPTSALDIAAKWVSREIAQVNNEAIAYRQKQRENMQ